MRWPRVALTVAVIVSCMAPPARAERIGRGNSLVWVGLNGNHSQYLTSPLFSPDGDEVGVHGAYSYFFCDAWTVVASGGIDAGKLRSESGGVSRYEYASHSWNVRLGFDRYAFINNDVALYAGPGLLYWTGHAEFPDYSVGRLPDVHQIAFNGRIGMLARLSGHVGLFGHIGQVIGSNSTKQNGAEITWWSNSHEGSVGLSLDF